MWADLWNNPDALNRLSRLILAMTLAFALWVVGKAALESVFPFRQVTVIGALHGETQSAARKLTRKLAGGFFSMDLHKAHTDFEALPWVQQAQIRRLWPGRLVIELTEHRAAAAWNDRATLNTRGEIFPVTPWTGLPRIYAPEGMEREVSRRYGEFSAVMKPMGMHIEQIVVSARLSWRLRLSPNGTPQGSPCITAASNEAAGLRPCGGISVELGRERQSERLARFARFYPQAVAAVGPIHRIDMRYPNGFAGEVAHPALPQATHKTATKQAKQAKQA